MRNNDMKASERENMIHSEQNCCENHKVTQAEAEQAVRTLISWAGDDPLRQGVWETPKRVAKAFREWFAGYESDPAEYLSKQFEEVAGYNAPVMLRDIPFHSRCEHHMASIIGKVHIAYLPKGKVVGISKLARVTEGFAKRLQIQERLTAEIAECIYKTLDAEGAAVMITAEHHCMTTRGVDTHDTRMTTFHLTGRYKTDPDLRREFMAFCNSSSHSAL